jgi:hypothetical protein
MARALIPLLSAALLLPACSGSGSDADTAPATGGVFAPSAGTSPAAARAAALTPDTATKGRALLVALAKGEKRPRNLTPAELELLRTMQAYRLAREESRR